MKNFQSFGDYVRGFAGGYGYDKASAAFIAAASQLEQQPKGPIGVSVEEHAGLSDFRKVQDNGHRWADQLRELGYTVQHVIEG